MEKLKKIFKEYIGYVLVIISVLLIKTYIVSPIVVSGDSMDSTLLDGDLMILNKTAYYQSDIERFDIVVIKYNDNYIIKRVIGIPGDTIVCEDNTLYINGKIVVEDYLDEGTFTTNFKINEIEDGYYFVLGDNREVSLDSRRIGLIKEDNVEGKAKFTIFPFNRWGNKK